ncbi:MAG: hypothetical protein ABJB11_17300 [Ferruginibacter sp.]
MADTRHIIEFGPKFCQAQFDFVLREDVTYKDAEDNPQKTSHWKRSFSPDITEVVFDLTITEWINTEEIVFLFAWIRKLILSNRKIKIHLPYGFDITRIYKSEKLNELKGKFNFSDNPKIAKKRNKRNIFLMVNWGLRNNTGLKDWNFENRLADNIYNERYDELLLEDTFNKVVPFTAISTNFDGELIKYDAHFKQVLSGSKSQTGVRTLFELESRIENILSDHACYSPFESKILSNVIFQELYLNTCQHSYTKKNKPDDKECFMALSFSGKRKFADTNNFSISFFDEKDKQAADFYKDKESILKQIQIEFKSTVFEKDVQLRKATLDKFNQVKNQSYLEYTFLDFGQGYTETLKESYIKNKAELKKQLSPQHDLANLDSQIIEYGFLLETSSIPIDQNIENYNLIPRGLYFLIDMVRRYKGMLKIRSGKGKVFYDFSDKVYHEVKDKKYNVLLHRPYSVKDSVIHCLDEQIEDFKGVLITIILPEKKTEQHKSEDMKSLSPVRLESEVLNNYIYYAGKEKALTGTFEFDNLHPKTYEYIGLLFLFNKVIEEYIKEEAKGIDGQRKILTSKELNNFFYNKLYSMLVEELKKFYEKNCVVFIDFGGLHFDTQFLKLIYYLMDTPRVNELTKVVFTNLDPEKEGIIKHLKERIADETLIPLLFKPIPCLSFNYLTLTNDVHWIGLRDESDEAVLTSVLFNNKSVAKQELSSIKNAEGNIFYEYDGWVYSFLVPLIAEESEKS